MLPGTPEEQTPSTIAAEVLGTLEPQEKVVELVVMILKDEMTSQSITLKKTETKKITR